MWREVAGALGLLRQRADFRRHRPCPLDEFVGGGDRVAADRGSRHRERIPRGARGFFGRPDDYQAGIVTRAKLPRQSNCRPAGGLPKSSVLGGAEGPLLGSILGRAIVEDGRGRRKLAFTSMSPRGEPPPRGPQPRGSK